MNQTNPNMYIIRMSVASFPNLRIWGINQEITHLMNHAHQWTLIRSVKGEAKSNILKMKPQARIGIKSKGVARNNLKAIAIRKPSCTTSNSVWIALSITIVLVNYTRKVSKIPHPFLVRGSEEPIIDVQPPWSNLDYTYANTIITNTRG